VKDPSWPSTRPWTPANASCSSRRRPPISTIRNKRILLVAQKTADLDDPQPSDLYEVGTLATILQLLKLPDGTVKVLVEGGERALIDRFNVEDHFSAEITPLAEDDRHDEREIDVLVRSVISQFEQYVKLNKKVPPEVLTSLSGIDEPGRLADTVAAHMALKLSEKQRILEIQCIKSRLEQVLGIIEGEIDVLQIEKRIRGRVKQQMEKSQREYYLNEQMKAIQKELGEMEDAPNELADLEQKIEEAGMPKEAKEKAVSELNKLKLMSPMSAEATVVRNYVDWLVKAPWKKRSKVYKDLKKAEDVLEADHYGLEKVKERILEYLAVQQRVKKLKGPILCLVGPPGVGKTSLGQSIARATNRKFVRMSLGGVRDEAEIRGHRRTYIGSMPGKIIQNLSKTGVRNPLFLLDEIDKMAMDFRGDPSSALLEVLDPEQNSTFADHYLEVDFDLSDTMFVCTANSLNIPAPLLDRMEVIRIPGYTEDEKTNIALRYLIPKQLKENGLKEKELKITEGAVRDIIRHYTRESGVRNLEREISKICRKVQEPRAGHAKKHGELPRRASFPLRQGRRQRSGRAGYRSRVDRGRWRASDHRGSRRPGQGKTHADGPVGRCHEGIHRGRDDRCSQSRQLPGSRRELPSERRCAHSRARRGHAKGRSICGSWHVYCAGVGINRHPRQERCGHDGRDHAEG
jgi:ATP-dependent Lon protease